MKIIYGKYIENVYVDIIWVDGMRSINLWGLRGGVMEVKCGGVWAGGSGSGGTLGASMERGLGPGGLKMRLGGCLSAWGGFGVFRCLKCVRAKGAL